MSRRSRSSRNIHILYEDEEVIGVNKPPGLLAVPIPKSNADNLEDRVKAYLIHQRFVPQAVHRIDRYTSGVMVFAKTRQAYEDLKEQFQNLEPDRRYIAIVRGQPKEEGTFTHHLKRIKRGFRNVVVSPEDPKGTLARLHYLTLERYPNDDVAIVEVELETGLKNQIRVQFAEQGHPLMGDRHYHLEEKKEARINRQALHALEVTIRHPRTNRDVTIRAPFPKDLKQLMSQLS
ncbi:MAG: RluA family pseudouridine synthase [Bacteroidota bacterium]